ncbi:Nucleic-acid-binding protein from transposon X-element [Eumeta japonica]|uniref:Nucleic-acid-binding protein from transposon X-element n=1 Tax=Eumeta variegata TaxID=151549 RepID=A0A4C1V637_EUMVA|nr:Nucleic-acid-binding protein from transposon X-element [Eumeta japonica]
MQCSDVSARVRVCHLRVPLGNAAEPVSAQRTAGRGGRRADVVKRFNCKWNRAAVGHKASPAVRVPRSRASSRASHTGLTWLDCTRRGKRATALIGRRIPNPVAGRNGDPIPRHALPEPSVTIEEDDGDATGSSSGFPAGLGKFTDEVNDDPAKDVQVTAEKRRRDSHSSPSPTLRPAPKKADQRTSLNTDTTRSPSLEPYAESTDSTSYAALTLEADSSSQNSVRTTTPGPARLISEADADIIPDTNTAAPPNTAANTGATTHKARGYPPIVVENLPNWVAHFEELRRLIGHAPNARPFGKGIRFLPKSDTEFRMVQRYLQAAARRDHQVTWYCYALEAEKPSKVGIRGLPVDTAPDTIVSALQELDFPAEYIKPIPPWKGRPGCLFYARLGHMSQGQLQKLYGVNALLNMPGITIEGWRGREGPPQCHRRQTFGHSSVNCHRPQRCVCCGEGHIAADCTRLRNQGPTCANCQGPHPASDRRCPVFRKRCPDDRPAYLSSSTDSDIGDTGPTNDRTPPYGHYRPAPIAKAHIRPVTGGARFSKGGTSVREQNSSPPTAKPNSPPQRCPDDRPAYLSSSTDSDIGDTGPTNDRTPPYGHYRTSVGRGGTHGGGKTKKKAEEGTISTPAPPEEFADPLRVQSSQAASEAATAMRAVWPRSMPIRKTRPAMVPPPPIARPRVEPQREMPPTS